MQPFIVRFVLSTHNTAHTDGERDNRTVPNIHLSAGLEQNTTLLSSDYRCVVIIQEENRGLTV